jgi:dTDP-4-dehydrorhamnose 3,5-epimerase
MSEPKLGGVNIAGHTLVKRKFFSDDRGTLLKVFEDQDIESLGFEPKIKQINLAETKQVGTIRGMHLQPSPFTEKKLITCIEGIVFDVVIDLRRDSETFLKWASYVLDASMKYSVVVPEGCAHGLQSLSENATLLYAHTNNFTAEFESGLNPLDPDLAIPWPVRTSNISERDSKLPTMKEWLEESNEV